MNVVETTAVCQDSDMTLREPFQTEKTKVEAKHLSGLFYRIQQCTFSLGLESRLICGYHPSTQWTKYRRVADATKQINFVVSSAARVTKTMSSHRLGRRLTEAEASTACLLLEKEEAQREWETSIVVAREAERKQILCSLREPNFAKLFNRRLCLLLDIFLTHKGSRSERERFLKEADRLAGIIVSSDLTLVSYTELSVSDFIPSGRLERIWGAHLGHSYDPHWQKKETTLLKTSSSSSEAITEGLTPGWGLLSGGLQDRLKSDDPKMTYHRWDIVHTAQRLGYFRSKLSSELASLSLDELERSSSSDHSSSSTYRLSPGRKSPRGDRPLSGDFDKVHKDIQQGRMSLGVAVNCTEVQVMCSEVLASSDTRKKIDLVLTQCFPSRPKRVNSVDDLRRQMTSGGSYFSSRAAGCLLQVLIARPKLFPSSFVKRLEGLAILESTLG